MSNKNYQKEYTIPTLNRFLEETFEVAFGDNAIEKDYYIGDVVNKLKEFSIKALFVEQLMEEDEEFIHTYHKWLEEEQ